MNVIFNDSYSYKFRIVVRYLYSNFKLKLSILIKICVLLLKVEDKSNSIFHENTKVRSDHRKDRFCCAFT